ncbi:MAG TPA: hypothetical protein VNA12_03355 [Mycobacteriales bacterium]|nr:hypothetical protein [Mycobacteriales bacterium]
MGDQPVVPEVVAQYPGVDFTVPATVIKPVHSAKGAPAPRMRIGEALTSAGIITPAQLEECLEYQRRLGPGTGQDRRLGAIVVEKGFATEAGIARGLSAITGFALVDPVEMDLKPAVVRLIPRALAAALRIVPLEAGTSWIQVAAADPFNRRAIDAVRDATGLTSVSLAVATPASVMLALEAAWNPANDRHAPFVPAPDLNPVPDADEEGDEAPQPTGALRPLGDRGPRWEYALIGDDMPSAHSGYTPDVARLDARLAEMGAQGWEAVGMVANGSRSRVLMKRALYRG